MKTAYKLFLLIICILAFQSCKNNSVGSAGDYGGKIVFSMTTGASPLSSGQTHIYVINSDGSGFRQLTHGGYEDMPRWSPDGSEIAFVSDSSSTSLGNSVWIMNSDGSNWRPLKRIPEEPTMAMPGEHPCWSPDGKEISFDWCTHCEYGVMIWDIYVVNVTSGDIIQLTDGLNGHPVNSNSSPAFSADGRRIYFNKSASDSTGVTTAGIYSMNTSGGDIREILAASSAFEYDVLPVLSPNGQEFAFVRGDTSGTSLFVADIDGSDPVELTSQQSGNTIDCVRWSEHGAKIMFSSGGSIFEINADGTGLTGLQLGGVEISNFDWTD